MSKKETEKPDQVNHKGTAESPRDRSQRFLDDMSLLETEDRVKTKNVVKGECITRIFTVPELSK